MTPYVLDDLSAADFGVLRALENEPEGLDDTEIAGVSRLSVSEVRELVQRLAALHLVSVNSADGDKLHVALDRAALQQQVSTATAALG